VLVPDLSAATAPSADPVAEITLREARAVLDEELERLPQKYRCPLILCYLEEKTRDEAVEQLGWPEARSSAGWSGAGSCCGSGSRDAA
jgi:DNA-directed RNA polymerase specialized sigma24 family protein